MYRLQLWSVLQIRMWCRLTLAALLVAVSALGLRIPKAHAAEAVIATIPVGLGPLAVGVNATTNRIYVANNNDNTVSVIDGLTNAVVATIPVESFPLSVAVNAVTNRIYVTNGVSNT